MVPAPGAAPGVSTPGGEFGIAQVPKGRLNARSVLVSFVSSYYHCVFGTKDPRYLCDLVSAVPSGLALARNWPPALKRRAIFGMSLRDKARAGLISIAQPDPAGQTADESQKLARLRLRAFLDSHWWENLTHRQHVLKFKDSRGLGSAQRRRRPGTDAHDSRLIVPIPRLKPYAASDSLSGL